MARYRGTCLSAAAGESDFGSGDLDLRHHERKDR